MPAAKRTRTKTTAAAADIINFLPQRYVERFPVADLDDFPSNPKDHDLGAITTSIDENGFYGVLVVQEWPKTPKYILAGHGRKDTLTQKGVTHVPVLLVKCDPKTARRIVLVDNRTTELGGYDLPKLAEFLTPLANDDALLGTGYDLDDVSDIWRGLQQPARTTVDPNAEWSGMPEYENEDQLAWKRVIVNFANADDLAAFAKLLKQQVLPTTRSIWYPRAEIAHVADKAYVAPGDDKPPLGL